MRQATFGTIHWSFAKTNDVRAKVEASRGAGQTFLIIHLAMAMKSDPHKSYTLTPTSGGSKQDLWGSDSIPNPSGNSAAKILSQLVFININPYLIEEDCPADYANQLVKILFWGRTVMAGTF